MSEEDIRSYSIEQIREMIARGESKTDWARVAALTDEDIEESMRGDPDWEGFDEIDWSKAQMVYPVKEDAISVQLDADIIDFFKAGGKEYQTRINDVLRDFMTEQRKAGGK